VILPSAYTHTTEEVDCFERMAALLPPLKDSAACGRENVRTSDVMNTTPFFRVYEAIDDVRLHTAPFLYI